MKTTNLNKCPVCNEQRKPGEWCSKLHGKVPYDIVSSPDNTLTNEQIKALTDSNKEDKK